MKKEEKELLLKDLCGRLPYGVKCNVGDNKPYTLSKIEVDSLNGHLLDFIEMKDGLNVQVYLSEVKPYLFPLSSMTEEERNEFQQLNAECDKMPTFDYVPVEHYRIFNWLNAHHFDYCGLIEKGLANDATGLNIY